MVNLLETECTNMQTSASGPWSHTCQASSPVRAVPAWDSRRTTSPNAACCFVGAIAITVSEWPMRDVCATGQVPVNIHVGASEADSHTDEP